MSESPSATPWQPDPATRELLQMIEEAGIPPMHSVPLADARQAMLDGRVNDIDPPALPKVEDRTIDGPGGDLALRCYYPGSAPEGGLSTLLYFHGGGFVIGDLDTHDTLCRQLCELAQVLVISVDYRLAPEHHYPAPVEDALASFSWLQREFRQVGADPARVAVGGDSAGGALAAVVAQHARDEGSPIRAQLLLYPVVDLSTTYPSHQEHGDIYPIPTPVLDWFWSTYLGPGRERDAALREQVWASPIRVPSCENLAPAFILTAGGDPLRDEAAAYAARLTGAGVETVYQCAMGTVHGFLRLGRLVPGARDALVSASHFLRQRL